MQGEEATGLAGLWRAAAARSEALGDVAMRDYRLDEARRCEAAEAARAGQPGHAWVSGAWDRQCVRCGLRVRSLCVGGEKLRRVEPPQGDSWIVFDGADAPLPPCTDGAMGEHATVVQTAPWRHT